MKLSIITINYNNASGLKRTLDNIESQTWKEYELVVVDGGSNDGGKEIISLYVNNHPDTKWVSEPDKGIYNAMNKGVKMSSGEYCIFMNSGDCFYSDNTLSDVIPFLDGDVDIISGAVKTDQFERNAPTPEELSLTFFIKASMNHQSTFIKRQLLVVTPYNEIRRIAADSEFFFQTMIIGNASYKNIPLCVSYCEAAGESGDLSSSINERIMAIKGLLPPRMGYDVDFIKKYHNPLVLKIGSMAYKGLFRKIYHLIHRD